MLFLSLSLSLSLPPFLPPSVPLSAAGASDPRPQRYRTPLLEQPPQLVNVAAVSTAAALEAYYRAAMNALMNAALTGARPAAFFPNMHVQIPTRVAYINGFKATRQVCEGHQKCVFGVGLIRIL